MKKLTILFILISGFMFSQTFDIKKMQSFINKTPAEFALAYNTKIESIKDNFGDEKISYEKVKFNDVYYYLIIQSSNKTIKEITIATLENTTNFFKINSEYLESITGEDNKDNFFISVNRKINGETKYFDNVNQLILNLKEGNYSLNYYTANIKNYKLKIEIFLSKDLSFILLK